MPSLVALSRRCILPLWARAALIKGPSSVVLLGLQARARRGPLPPFGSQRSGPGVSLSGAAPPFCKPSDTLMFTIPAYFTATTVRVGAFVYGIQGFVEPDCAEHQPALLGDQNAVRGVEISSKRWLMSSVELGYPSSVMRHARSSRSSLLASLTIKPSKPAASFADPTSSPKRILEALDPRSSACDGRWITCSPKGGL